MTSILVVDENSVSSTQVVTQVRESFDWHVQAAATAAQALTLLDAAPIDALVADMQTLCGTDPGVLQQLRSRHPRLPVILLVDEADLDSVIEALHNGATTFVRKDGSLQSRLLEILERVMASSRVARDRKVLLDSMESCSNTFVLGNDVRILRAIQHRVIDSLKMFGIATELDELRVSLVLEEAFLNAVYHGNLDLSSKLKDSNEGLFEQTARTRMQLEPWCCRRVRLTERVDREKAIITIQDEGAGFDVSKVRDCRTEEGLHKASGRGLMLMHAFMDEVHHNDAGNAVTLVKWRPGVERNAGQPAAESAATTGQLAEMCAC